MTTMKKLTGHEGGWSSSRSCRRRGAHRAGGADAESSTAATMAQPIRFVRRNAMAAGPMSSAVERIAPMARDDRPDGEGQGEHVEQPDDPHGNAPGGGHVGARPSSAAAVGGRRP